MSNDFPDYLRDMNHDGDIDSHDFALFHEMQDEDDRAYASHTSSYTKCVWTRKEWKDFFRHWLLMYVCFAPIGALTKGSIPTNFFTCSLGIIFALVGLKLLCDIFDML